MLDIVRVVHNYVIVEGPKRKKRDDDDKRRGKRSEKEAPQERKTPAMKLGLARAPVTLERILYFKND